MIELLRREIQPAVSATANVARFVDALAFNWLIAGTDAHAKNYSVLIASAQVRLAPLYDVATALPYDDMYPPKLRMAMRIGGEYGIERIGVRHWRRFAVANGLDPDGTLERIDDLAARMTDGFATASGNDAVKAPESDLPTRLLDRVVARVRRCREVIARG